MSEENVLSDDDIMDQVFSEEAPQRNEADDAPEAPEAPRTEDDGAQGASDDNDDAINSDPDGEGSQEEAPTPDGRVPLAALQAERAAKKAEADARKAAEDRAQQLQEELNQRQNSEPVTPGDVFGLGEPPDPAEDPAGFFQHQQSLIAANQINQNLNVSKRFFTLTHNEELANKVEAFATGRFDSDPNFATKVLFAEDPYAVAYAAYQEAENAKAFEGLSPEELAEFRAWKETKGKEAPAANPATTIVNPAAKPAAPKQTAPLPKSLASEPGAGGIEGRPPPSDDSFLDIFPQ